MARLDATRSVLRARKEPLIILEKKNGGQASAFNAGFARATGDIVVFLDADDTLAPDAVEILCMAWHDSFVAMSFKLNLIDAAGRFCGFYEVDPRDGDMRPELIGRGHFGFMPTSGNAFNRRLIAPAFPLPEPRWRISADAVLMRAAALAGPIRQLPLALGNYRAHGGQLLLSGGFAATAIHAARHARYGRRVFGGSGAAPEARHLRTRSRHCPAGPPARLAPSKAQPGRTSATASYRFGQCDRC